MIEHYYKTLIVFLFLVSFAVGLIMAATLQH